MAETADQRSPAEEVIITYAGKADHYDHDKGDFGHHHEVTVKCPSMDEACDVGKVCTLLNDDDLDGERIRELVEKGIEMEERGSDLL